MFLVGLNEMPRMRIRQKASEKLLKKCAWGPFAPCNKHFVRFARV